MIASLTGTLTVRDASRIIVETGGVGYEVLIPLSTYYRLAAAERELPIFEYPPNEVKLCVAGHGHADKAQVKYMVRKMLRLDAAIELADDASDALAIALCHLGRGRLPNLVEAIERVASRPAASRPRKPRLTPQ